MSSHSEFTWHLDQTTLLLLLLRFTDSHGLGSVQSTLLVFCECSLPSKPLANPEFTDDRTEAQQGCS